MKIIKVGRSHSNDLVLENMTVSSEHARITITDKGDAFIKDLNSSNGTFVNGTRITEETKITASDEVKAAGVIIDWVKFIEKGKFKEPPHGSIMGQVTGTLTIGRANVNNIVFSFNDVSGSHATLIKSNMGEILIRDNNSKNGTFVNGKKITSQLLRPGDVVLIANKYPLDWANAFKEDLPPSKSSNENNNNNNKKTIIGTISAVAVLVLAFVIWWQWPVDVYKKYKKAVVLIEFSYCYHATAGNEDLGYWVIYGDQILPTEGDKLMEAHATGFFVSKDGKIITNKHVTTPWEYDNSGEKLKKFIQEFLKTMASQSRQNQVNFLPLVNEVKIEGVMTSMGIYLNDTYVSSSDIIKCSIIKDSGNKDIDVALMQTNSKTLPAGVDIYVDLNKAIIDHKNIKEGTEIYAIGFPLEFQIGATEQGIQANCQDGKITQLRGDIEFGHNAATYGGASGSPVFDKHGNLIGVHHAGLSSSEYKAQGFNMAIWAKHAVDLVK